MSMLHGIGDEVAWFAIAIIFITIILSATLVWTTFISQYSGLDHQPISNTNEENEEAHEVVNSSVDGVEENEADCDAKHDRTSTVRDDDDTCDRRTDDVNRTEELNSCSEVEGEIVVVESCSENAKAESNSVKTCSVNDPVCCENVHEHSSSSTVTRRILTTTENTNADVQSSSSAVRNGTSASSTASATSETEQTYSDQIVIRIKYLNDMERTVSTRLSKIIGDFKRDHFSEELASNKTVRLIFNGQLLRNEMTLQHYGVSDGCAVHVHITQTDPQRPPTIVESNVDLDLSHLLWPLLSIIIILLWALYYKYPQFFNVTSTGILLVFTGGLIFVYSENRLQTRN